jgi:hypothetical protein
MSRTKSLVKPKQKAPAKAKSVAKKSVPVRADKSVFFETLHSAEFPADIIIAPRAGARKPVTTVAKATVAPRPSLSRGKADTAASQIKIRSQPPRGRKTAAGATRVASTKRPKQSEYRATPPSEIEIRPLALAAAIFETPETVPLPRAVAIVPYRKNGPIALFGYWLRKSRRSILDMFKSPKAAKLPKSAIIEINRLRRENLLLQRRIEILMAERQPEHQ